MRQILGFSESFSDMAKRQSIILEIAKKAHVSRAAVYAALSDKMPSTIGLSEKKKILVQQIASELGYVRNDLARSLVTGKTYTIGILVHSFKNRFFVDMFNYLDEVADSNGYSALIANSEFDDGREARKLSMFLSRQVDGLIIAQDPSHKNKAILDQIHQKGIPIVTLGELPDEKSIYPNVSFDENLGDNLAVECLWSRGHRKVSYLSGESVGNTSKLIHKYRREKFCDAWRELAGDGHMDVFEVDDPENGGVFMAKHILSMAPKDRPTGIACSNDRLALSLIAALRSLGLSVPADVSVIGFDDIDVTEDSPVPLTTVRLPVDKLAFEAWELLYNEMNGDAPTQNKPRKPVRVSVKPELVLRESVKAL